MNRRLAGILLTASLSAAVPQAHAAEAAPPLSSSLTGTMLYVVDPDRAVAFYRDVLGLSLAMTLDHGTKREYMMRFVGDSRQAGLILLHDSSPAAPARLEHGNAFVRLVVRVSDMDAVIARLDAVKVPHGEPRDAGHGHRVMMITDPEGYALEIIQATSVHPEPKK